MTSPVPPSPVIARLEWAPAETIVRQCRGSDNFPLTWGDDDALYTTYGDGWGFEPKLKEKLGLGFARIEGMPPDHRGVNIRSTGENPGAGRRGKKGSGLLMVDGVLWLWLFHADEQGGKAQLAWSGDHARTWTFAEWMFAEFGLCTFVNFGRNDAGARDGYVYTVSHDGPRADTPADRFVLLRVPADRIADRQAYEFFVRLDPNGMPVWSEDIGARGAVFTNPGRCLRSGISYNAALGRYLWWQQVPNATHPQKDQGDTRFEGGFGIYDAPEPWGPWTVVYQTETWDVGPGERAEFPPKWMSPDGLTLWLAFSGEDSFSVRKATLTCR
ncbi:MAG: hypothetical protein JXR77_01675 [Lentisphaeria bacterium]|nr:hypothetical protein [Lentisphaeria bacterium]